MSRLDRRGLWLKLFLLNVLLPSVCCIFSSGLIWLPEIPLLKVGLGGFGVTCSPRDPRFAGSTLAEVDGFFQDVKFLSTSPPGGTWSRESWVWDFRLIKEPQAWKNRPLRKINRHIHILVSKFGEHNRSKKCRSALGSTDHPTHQYNTKASFLN